MTGLGAKGLGLSVLLGAVAFAQNPPQPTFRTEANYVRVDVYPTRDGVPIADLTKDDFEIVESGAPQKIEQFEHVLFRGVAQDSVIEPNSVRDARRMLETTRGRV